MKLNDILEGDVVDFPSSAMSASRNLRQQRARASTSDWVALVVTDEGEVFEVSSDSPDHENPDNYEHFMHINAEHGTVQSGQDAITAMKETVNQSNADPTNVDKFVRRYHNQAKSMQFATDEFAVLFIALST